MTGPLVSIVLPARDAERHLPAALNSVAGQTCQDWELVAIDDGSKDGTRAILEEHARRDPRIRLIVRPPEGIAEALRLGCTAARGRFVARMDADDVMRPERLERQAAFLECNPDIGLVSCQVAFGGDRACQGGYAAHVDWVNSLLSPETIALRRFVESPVPHPSVMFRRELLDRHGGYQSGDFPEDYELWLRWMDAGVRFAKLAQELLIWNDPAGRLSRTDTRYDLNAFYRIKCRYLARRLLRDIPLNRSIWLWGAGRTTRKRFRSLEAEGVAIAGYIDIDLRKKGLLSDGRAVLMRDELPPKEGAFILAGVSSRGAREEIQADLHSAGWLEGSDYLLAA